jgi:hypothetical protein
MPEPNSPERAPRDENALPPVSGVHDAPDVFDERPDESAASEAFQALANEVRVSVLVHLLRAEREGTDPRSFADIQDQVGSDSSAGFAYHLRQLSGHFVRKTPDGYVLTPAGRRAARAVLSGTFTSDDHRAS